MNVRLLEQLQDPHAILEVFDNLQHNYHFVAAKKITRAILRPP